MTVYLKVESCHRCPYCSGRHPDLLVGWEALSCAYVRKSALMYPDEEEVIEDLDRLIGQYFRSAGESGEPDMAPPEWCPLDREVDLYVRPASKIRIVRV